MSLILATSIAFALGLPAVYKSKATILIEQQEVPQDFVRSLVTSFAEQRIQVIRQKLLSTRNLIKHIEKYDLYTQERRVSSIDGVVAKMRENIDLEMISANVVDPSGRARTATIAFSLSFVDKSPKIAQTLTNELVTLFLNENIKNRSESAIEASSFLATEGDKLRNTIATLELKLAEFKERNGKYLPELAALNVQMLHKVESEVAEVKRLISDMQERKVYLMAELSQQPEIMDEQFSNPNYIPPTFSASGPTDPDVRLQTLQAEYLAATSKYSAGHPDVSRLKREIDSLQVQSGSTGGNNVALDNRISEVQAKLASARERYSADHPDIKRFQSELSALDVQRTASVTKPNKRRVLPFYIKSRKNPAYVTLKSQMEAGDTEIKSLQAKLILLDEKFEDYSTRLTKTPQVEREYKNLIRDYESAQKKYKDITEKELEAQLAQSLESERKGERFTLIEPPILPEEPFKPNRIAIAFLGLVFSLAGGLGAATIAEVMNDSVRGRQGVLEMLGEPPLAVVPYIITVDDTRKRILHRSFLIFGTLMALIVASVLIHFYVMPLDVLWFRSLRRVGL